MRSNFKFRSSIRGSQSKTQAVLLKARTYRAHYTSLWFPMKQDTCRLASLPYLVCIPQIKPELIPITSCNCLKGSTQLQDESYGILQKVRALCNLYTEEPFPQSHAGEQHTVSRSLSLSQSSGSPLSCGCMQRPYNLVSAIPVTPYTRLPSFPTGQAYHGPLLGHPPPLLPPHSRPVVPTVLHLSGYRYLISSLLHSTLPPPPPAYFPSPTFSPTLSPPSISPPFPITLSALHPTDRTLYSSL